MTDKTDTDQWEDISEQCLNIQNELYNLNNMLNESNIPDSVSRFQFTRMEDALYKFQNMMRERFDEEHPDDELGFHIGWNDE